MKEDNRIILAIETAIGGGSISLFRGEVELATLEGEKEISRAEDLLANITGVLATNSMELQDLNEIVVSVGPGSYTGIRVGIATALGLKKALGTDCTGVDTLQALALMVPEMKRVVAAVPLGRADVCWRIVESGIPGVINVDKAEAFLSFLESSEEIIAMTHGALYDAGSRKMINAGTGMSRHIANAARVGKYAKSLEPLYVRG